MPIFDDDIVEGDETFTVTLAVDTAPTGVTIGDGEATGTITDDDEALVTLSPAMATAAENGTFTYTVSLDAEVDEAVNLTWTATAAAGDTATVADDLQETTDTVSFAANDTEDKTFTIRPFDDTDDEPDETFTVTLSATGTLPVGVTIDDDAKFGGDHHRQRRGRAGEHRQYDGGRERRRRHHRLHGEPDRGGG